MQNIETGQILSWASETAIGNAEDHGQCCGVFWAPLTLHIHFQVNKIDGTDWFN